MVNNDLKKEIRKMVSSANLEVYRSDGKLMSVGLARGESKRLQNEGIPRKKQIKYLDYLQDNPNYLDKLLKDLY